MLLFAEIMTAQGPDPDNWQGDANLTNAPLDENLFLWGVVALIIAYLIINNRLKKCSYNF